MRYVGNKTRIARYLLEYMTPALTTTDWYVEPFCGALGMLASVKSKHRIANDANPYLIAMWKAVQNGWHGIKIDEFLYNEIRKIIM